MGTTYLLEKILEEAHCDVCMLSMYSSTVGVTVEVEGGQRALEL